MNQLSRRSYSNFCLAVAVASLILIAAWSMGATTRAQTDGTATPSPTEVATATATPTATPSQANPTATASPTPAAAPVLADLTDDAAVTHSEHVGGGGGNNLVHLYNQTDDRLRIKGSIQLNRIPGPSVSAENAAEAVSSCTDCQSIAVALQIDLISRTATTIAPQNAAVALNVQCTRCTTVAKALQYVIEVDDPTEVPGNVKALIKSMDRELKAIEHDASVDVTTAEAEIDGVVAQFTELADSLAQQRDQKDD